GRFALQRFRRGGGRLVETPLLGQQLAAYGVPPVARWLASQRRQTGCRAVPLRPCHCPAGHGGGGWGHRKQQIVEADDLVPIGLVIVPGAVMLSGDRRLKLVWVRDAGGPGK